jgi:long-chain acyl-CoA synthetase
MQASQNIALFMGMHSGLREYITVPLTHSFGLGRARTLLGLGGTMLASEGPFSPQKMAQVVAERQVNALSAVPAGITMAMDSAERSLAPLVRQIRLIELGSAHMPVSQKERLLQFFPHARICMHYGLTEASRSTFLDFDADRLRLSSVGKASPNVQVEIRDPDGQPLPVGKSGEVVVRGAHVTPGYIGDPELSARVVSARGIRTGDLGWMDEQGYLHLSGRLDDQINVGGIKVSPSELEEPLRAAYPDLELCVVGVPDPQMLLGEVPVVVYSRRPGSELDLARARASLAGHLDPRKLPLRVVAVDAIPKTQNGKIQRAVLRRALETTDVGTPPAPTR